MECKAGASSSGRRSGPTLGIDAGPPFEGGSTRICNARLLSSVKTHEVPLYDVTCSHYTGLITNIEPARSFLVDLFRKPDHLPTLWDKTSMRTDTFTKDQTRIDAEGSWLMPGLNHPHIHLDKCYLLGDPDDASDPSPEAANGCGQIESGDFAEALSKTFKAKSLFTTDSLRTRMTHLLRASLSAGVTSLTTHIEADPSMDPSTLSLDVALELKREWADRITIRIVVFAQERCLVSGSEGDGRREAFEEACERKGVDACGSAPYVEKREEGDEESEVPTGGRGERNARWVFEVAKRNKLDVDFHLDYDLFPTIPPLLPTVVSIAKSYHPLYSTTPATSRSPRRSLTIGHTTHLSLYTRADWDALAESAKGLDLTLVALPTSDLYMIGRGAEKWSEAGRGSFNIWEASKRGIKVKLGLNNISNLFNPSANPDPLSVLPPLAIPLFQNATPEAQLALLEMITLPLRPPSEGKSTISLEVGDRADMVLVHATTTAREAVMCPGWGRSVIKGGKVVARREAKGWVLGES